MIHILLGALIAVKLENLLLIAALCIIGHFVLDIIPHWDGFFDNKNFILMDHAALKKKDVFLQAIDVTASAFILIFLTQSLGSVVFIGAFFSLLPDIMKLGFVTRLRKRSWYMKLLKFHARIQRETGPILGLISQLVIAVIILMLLF